jgi:hypothetical protein
MLWLRLLSLEAHLAYHLTDEVLQLHNYLDYINRLQAWAQHYLKSDLFVNPLIKTRT